LLCDRIEVASAAKVHQANVMALGVLNAPDSAFFSSSVLKQLVNDREYLASFFAQEIENNLPQFRRECVLLGKLVQREVK
jgi:hypothetical protein